MDTMQVPPPVRPMFNWAYTIRLCAIFCCFPGSLLILPIFLAPFLFMWANRVQADFEQRMAVYNAYYGISTFMRPTPSPR